MKANWNLLDELSLREACRDNEWYIIQKSIRLIYVQYGCVLTIVHLLIFSCWDRQIWGLWWKREDRVQPLSVSEDHLSRHNALPFVSSPVLFYCLSFPTWRSANFKTVSDSGSSGSCSRRFWSISNTSILTIIGFYAQRTPQIFSTPSG